MIVLSSKRKYQDDYRDISEILITDIGLGRSGAKAKKNTIKTCLLLSVIVVCVWLHLVRF